jgi:hypothetical protein
VVVKTGVEPYRRHEVVQTGVESYRRHEVVQTGVEPYRRHEVVKTEEKFKESTRSCKQQWNRKVDTMTYKQE